MSVYNSTVAKISDELKELNINLEKLIKLKEKELESKLPRHRRK